MPIEKEVMLNKQYRGQIMRVVFMFYPNPITVRQVKLSLMEYGLSNQADIFKHLYYLENKEYIKRSEGLNKDIKDDDMVVITAKGIDLAEGTIKDDGLHL